MESHSTDYSSLFYLGSSPKWIYDPSTFEIREVNRAAVDLYGYSREEFLRLTHRDLHSKEETSNLLAAHEGISDHEGSLCFGVFTHRKKSGKKIRVKVNGHKVDYSGKKCVVAVGQDVSEEERNQNLLNLATSLARIGSWELDLANKNSDSMYWSPMTKQILEVDDSYNPTLTGGFEFYSGASKIRIQKAVELLIQEGKEFNEELLIITATGKDRWIRCIGQSEWVQGKCVRIFGSFQDIHTIKSLQLQLGEILGSISDAFYAVDRDWNFTYFNKEAENLLLKKASDVIGKNMWQEFPTIVGSGLEAIYHRAAQLRNPESFEYLNPGDGCWYELSIYPSMDGVSTYFRNIDERKQSTAKLEKAYQEKNNILESIGDAFFSVNKDWIVTYWNKQAEQLLGKQREVILGKNLWEEYADAVDTDFYSQYHKALETQTNLNFEEYYPALDKWFKVSVYPSVGGLSVYFQDVTLGKQADIRLVQANERFEKVTEATNDAIWDWNILDDSLYWGEGFKNLFGYDTNNTTPSLQSWSAHIHPEDLTEVQNSLSESLENPDHKSWQKEYRYQKENGTFAFVIDKGIIIRDKNDKAFRMVGAMADISERKRHESEMLELNESLKKQAHELKLSNEQLEQFAFIASHDLQEPLRMISSFLELLRRKYGDQLDDKAHQYIHFATDGAKRMKQIILDLLEYSRAGKYEEVHGKINLESLFNDYKSLRKKIILEKSAALIHSPLPEVEGYRAPLTQVFHCLLDNAIKYSRDGVTPLIELGVEETDSEWVFSVRDNGLGIAPEYFDKIFVIFQRLHNRTQYEGTGIGLSIVKKQVESWGGKVWLESAPGQGSAFFFTLPK